MKSIYSYYKDRLVEVSGKNRSLFARKISKKFSYDLGKLLDGDYEAINEWTSFLWEGKKLSFRLIDKNCKERLIKNLRVEQRVASAIQNEKSGLTLEEENVVKNDAKKRLMREEFNKALTLEINALTSLKREIEEFARETGRYELFVGYPFVCGALKDTLVKAPLLLFPVVIDFVDKTTVDIQLKQGEPIQLNKVFLYAYAQNNKLNIEDVVTEFASLGANGLRKISDVVEYLRNVGFHIGYEQRKGLFAYDRGKEPEIGDSIEVKHYCVLGRFPLANSIYNDYKELDKKRLTNDAILELLNTKTSIKEKKMKQEEQKGIYTINNLDYAQETAIRDVDSHGNMVVYGPPGTGKSQTIVNIISDAISKNKKVLVVSQKKAALDVVFSRLGLLNNKVMFVSEADKQKREFYERVLTTHQSIVESNVLVNNNEKFEILENKINNEISELEDISKTLFEVRQFGLSLQEMYEHSYMIGKTSYEYSIYKDLMKDEGVMSLNYNELREALSVLKEKNKPEMFYKFIELKQRNPLIDNLKTDLSIHTINQVKSKLGKVVSSLPVFDISKYPYSRQVLAYYKEAKQIENLKPLVKMMSKLENPKLARNLKISCFAFPIYPIFKYKMVKKENIIEKDFKETYIAIKNYMTQFEFLEEVLSFEGYLMMMDNVLNGNSLYLKMLQSALVNYVSMRDINLTLKQLTDNQKMVLNFAYSNTNSLFKFKVVIEKLLSIRIYHEIVLLESECKNSLSKLVDFDNIKARITNLQDEQKEIAKYICLDKFKDEYKSYYANGKNNKDYLYQISKKQNLWTIRKFMEVYGDYVLNLFPCWLLSPENVSTLLPLKKDMFDIVLFDEASQVFIENSLPSIFRGKKVVVAGDAKQLRPTSLFIKRYFGSDIDDEIDYSTQAALEVESLLDLAVARYNTSHLTYHYRSRSEELINFSNHVFYENKLQISPNISRNVGKKAIERIIVNGKWQDRRNEAEVIAVVDTLKKIFRTRKNNESIGIICFNTEQEAAIEDAIDKATVRDEKFRESIVKETNRKENGEDTSLFIKNLENVQGDERDIIIFSVGYARNEGNKVASHFGPLSIEGGENRLNVAITRAKEKIYLITSIEPEELKVETSKNLGPKIFKDYLKYVRAVSTNSPSQVKAILKSYDSELNEPKMKVFESDSLEMQIKKELENLGYKIDLNIGNGSNSSISLGVYDKSLDKYLLGIECDSSAYKSSSSVLERDVYKGKFLKACGWNVIRVWSRNWWMNKQATIKMLIKSIEKSKEKLLSNTKRKSQTKTTAIKKPTEEINKLKIVEK